jgi:anaerobic ribonucleoside-triphosphate reductase activating protein
MRVSEEHGNLRARLRVHRILPLSLTNGPGRRFVLWVQGCFFNCPGCFNKESHALSGGTDMPVREILDLCDVSGLDGVTISGGEPVMQAPELALFLKEIKSLGLNTMVYTGFRFSGIRQGQFKGVRELLGQTDLLVDGPFRRLIPPNGEWVGSGNQRVIALSRTGMDMKKQRKTSYVEQEYILSPTGDLIQTGI